eukprot:c13498_g2_i1 orf=205-561(-)
MGRMVKVPEFVQALECGSHRHVNESGGNISKSNTSMSHSFTEIKLNPLPLCSNMNHCILPKIAHATSQQSHLPYMMEEGIAISAMQMRSLSQSHSYLRKCRRNHSAKAIHTLNLQTVW